jgi:hypothetical protein
VRPARNFIKQLADHMNAEVVGGTLTNIREAIEWIRYTYLHVRKEVGELCRCKRDGALIQKFVRMLPRVDVSCSVHPITNRSYHSEMCDVV